MPLTEQKIQSITDSETQADIRNMQKQNADLRERNTELEKQNKDFREKAAKPAAAQQPEPPKQPSAKEVLQRQKDLAQEILKMLEGDESVEATKLRGTVEADLLDEHALMNTYSELKQKKEAAESEPK